MVGGPSTNVSSSRPLSFDEGGEIALAFSRVERSGTGEVSDDVSGSAHSFLSVRHRRIDATSPMGTPNICHCCESMYSSCQSSLIFSASSFRSNSCGSTSPMRSAAQETIEAATLVLDEELMLLIEKSSSETQLEEPGCFPR